MQETYSTHATFNFEKYTRIHIPLDFALFALAEQAAGQQSK